MVMLASRLYGGYHKNLGRETFLVPVIWEDGWPVVCPDSGKVEWSYPAPALEQVPYPQEPARDDFDGEELGNIWNFLGAPRNPVYRLGESRLWLKTIAEPICPASPPMGGPPFDGRKPIYPRALSFVGRRQQHISFHASTKILFNFEGNDTAGLCLLQNNFVQIRLELAAEAGKRVARVVRVRFAQAEASSNTTSDSDEIVPALHLPFLAQNYQVDVLGTIPVTDNTLVLSITQEGQSLSFAVGASEENLKTFVRDIDASFLDSVYAGGFVGTYIGMFASGNGTDSGHEAAFDWFTYTGKE